MASGLALTGILAGVEKAPDSWFDRIPMFRGHEAEARIQARKEEKERKKKGSSHRRHSVDDRRRSDKYRDDDHRRKKSYHEDDRRRDSHRYDDEYGHDGRDRRRGRGRAQSVDHYKDRRERDSESSSDDYTESRSRNQAGYPPRNAPPAAYPVNQHRGSVPVNGGYVSPVSGPVAGVAAGEAYQNNQLRRGSGPTAPYVPYAHVYNDQAPRRSAPAVYPPVSGAGHYTESPPSSPIVPRTGHRGRGGVDGGRNSEDSYESEGYPRHRRGSRRD